MVHEPSYASLASSINNVLLVYFEEIASTLVLQFLSRLIFSFSLIRHAQSYYFTHILDNLKR